MRDGKTVAIIPGSFDPITYGHIDIVKRAAELYDIIYFAVMINSEKQYLFSIEERERIAKLALRDIQNVSVISSTGMLWKLAKELNADAIVKGYRNQTDYEYEIKMAKFNAEHNPHAKTILLESKYEFNTLSSTFLRNEIFSDRDISSFLPQAAAEEIYSILKKRSSN